MYEIIRFYQKGNIIKMLVTLFNPFVNYFKNLLVSKSSKRKTFRNIEGSTNEKSSSEGDEIGKSSVEKTKSESDDKERDEPIDKNKEKMDKVTRRDEFISKFDMAETTTGKRLREGDEILESSVKKAKLERDDEEAGSNKHGKDICEQNDISAKAEEDHFLRLFTLILNVIIDVKGIKDEEIGKSMTYLARSRNFSDKTTHFSDVDLVKFENIVAYLYRWGRLGAGLARFKILNAIRNCSTLEEKLKKTNLNIICLGAGPGNDAIGFLSALSELYYPENLNITLVDKFKEWFFCTKLADAFIKEDNFGKVSELCKKTKVELFYIDTDIEMRQAPKHEDYLQDLSKADAILICRLITNFKMPKVKFTEHLRSGMGKEAIILLINKFFPDNWNKFDVLHQSEEGYSLSKEASMRFSSSECLKSTYPITVMRKKQS